MKTFKQFCEQAYNPFPNQKPNVVQQFVSRARDAVDKKVQDLSNTVNMASAALDPRGDRITRWGAMKDLKFKLKGGNPNNPDQMQTQGPKDNKSYSFKPYTYQPSFIKPTAKTFFHSGREV